MKVVTAALVIYKVEHCYLFWIERGPKKNNVKPTKSGWLNQMSHIFFSLGCEIYRTPHRRNPYADLIQSFTRQVLIYTNCNCRDSFKLKSIKMNIRDKYCLSILQFWK